MIRKWTFRGAFCCILVLGTGWPAAVRADIDWEGLDSTRVLTHADWLKLRLEVLGQRLSFPAYRVYVALDEDRRIAFEFLASSGLADHLTETVDREQAEEIMTYHAEGIRNQVERLLEEDFPALWNRYEPDQDFIGVFRGPGSEWDDPPVTIGAWQENRFTWQP